MRYTLLLSSILALPVLLSASGDRSHIAAPIAGDEQDLIFLHDSRPYLLRLHLQTQGRPAQTVWSSYLDSLFEFLDDNHDGFLSQHELSHAPSVDQLMEQLLDAKSVNPAPAPEFAAVDMNPTDGKISKEELKAYYRRHGAGPLHVEIGRGWQSSTDQLTTKLFELLNRHSVSAGITHFWNVVAPDGKRRPDADDAKLSLADLEAAFETLRKLDANDDEVISFDEWAPYMNFDVPFRAAPRGRVNLAPLPFLLVIPGEPPEAVARELIARYDRDQDGRVNRAEIGLDAVTFERLDADRDGLLDAKELAAWLRQVPDIELAIQFDDRPAHEAVADLGSAMPDRLAHRLDAGDVTVLLRDTRLVLHRNGQLRPSLENRKESYLSRFKAADGNGDGFLDSKEVYRPPFEFVALLRLADRDGDGRLSMKELEAYAELQAKATSCFTVLTIADRGQGLFELLDTDRDGRLSQRELRTARARLACWDRNGDGFLARSELPHQFIITVSHGHSQFTDRVAGPPGYGPAARSAVPMRGPAWFRHMDRNGDGDVSRREFLGTAEDFKRLDLDGDGLISVEEAERAERQRKR